MYLTNSKRLLVDDDFMESGFDQTTTKMFKLLACLDKKVVPFWHFHGDTLPGISCPDMKTWISGATVDGEEIEISMKAGKDGVLFAIFDQVGCCWSEKMWTKDGY